jgi:hypothetical protein
MILRFRGGSCSKNSRLTFGDAYATVTQYPYDVERLAQLHWE